MLDHKVGAIRLLESSKTKPPAIDEAAFDERALVQTEKVLPFQEEHKPSDQAHNHATGLELQVQKRLAKKGCNRWVFAVKMDKDKHEQVSAEKDCFGFLIKDELNRNEGA